MVGQKFEVFLAEFQHRFNSNIPSNVRAMILYMQESHGTIWSRVTVTRKIQEVRRRLSPPPKETPQLVLVTSPHKELSKNPSSIRRRISNTKKIFRNILNSVNITPAEKKYVLNRISIEEGFVSELSKVENDIFYIMIKALRSSLTVDATLNRTKDSIPIPLRIAGVVSGDMKEHRLQAAFARLLGISPTTVKNTLKCRKLEDLGKAVFGTLTPRSNSGSLKVPVHIANGIQAWWDENTRVSSFTKNVVRWKDEGVFKQHIIHWMEDTPKGYHQKWLGEQPMDSSYLLGKTTFCSLMPSYVRRVKAAFQCVCIYCKKFRDALHAFKSMRREIHTYCCNCDCDLCVKYCRSKDEISDKPRTTKSKNFSILDICHSRDAFEASFLCPKVGDTY